MLVLLFIASGYCGSAGCIVEPGAYSEVSAHVGASTLGYGYTGGRRAELFTLVGAEGRFRPTRAQTFADRFVVEGGLTALVPTLTLGSAFGVAATARVGLVFGLFAFTVGAHARLDATPAPFSILPSLTLAFRPNQFGLRFGLFDRPGGALGHLALEWRNYYIGFVAPLGGELGARIALGEKWALDLRGEGYVLAAAYAITASVRIAFGEGLVWQ